MELNLQYKRNVMISLFVFFATIGFCYASTDGAYMRNANDGFKLRKNWMSKLRDDVHLSELALPGTHASAAYDGNDGLDRAAAMYTQMLPFPISLVAKQVVKEANYRQALNFKQQLEYGIRVLDIYVIYFNNQFSLIQSGTFLYLSLEEFINKLADFLAENPTETVLFTLKIDLQPGKNDKPPSVKLNEILVQPRIAPYYLKTHNPTISLKEARGKFIILSVGPAFVDNGLDFKGDSFKIMDHNYIRTGWDLHSWKWKPVKDHLHIATEGDKNVFYVDYLHAWGGTFPYFAASGHALPFTKAPRLPTGFMTLGWKWPFPEFPRKCFLFYCIITFEGINILTRNEVQNFNKVIQKQKRTVGIIMADFPGDSLIETIIKNNALLEKK